MHSETGNSLIALLNNINDLITISQDRKTAQEVMRCLTVYAKDHTFKIPQDKINNFHRICIDSRPCTLSALIGDIARDIVAEDRKNKKKS